MDDVKSVRFRHIASARPAFTRAKPFLQEIIIRDKLERAKMIIRVNDVMALIRQELGRDPSEPVFSERVSIRFRRGVELDITIEHYIPGIGDLNVDVDAEENVINLEIFP